MHPSDFGSNRSRIPPVDRNGSVDGTLITKFMQKLSRSMNINKKNLLPISLFIRQ